MPPTKPRRPDEPHHLARHDRGRASPTGWRGARLHSAHGRARDAARQDRPRRDAQGRGHHGRRRRRAGADRRGRRRVRGDGARARAGRHPPRGRRRPHVRPGDDPRDPGGRDDPRDGEVPHRPLRRGADPRGARGRLHRRVGGADARRRAHHVDKWAFTVPVRLRRDEPRRGAAAHRRGRGDDPHEGRGRHRRHRQRGHAHARRLRRDPPAAARCATRSCSPRRRSCARRTSSSAGSPRTAGCRSSPSPRAASRRRPTRRSACSSAPTACSSARASSSRAIPTQRAKAIVEATTHFADPKILAEVSAGPRRADGRHLLEPLADGERLEVRGW